MNYFEECLTRGDWLSQDDRRALYKYLRRHYQKQYRTQAIALLESKNLSKSVARGLTIYSLFDGSVSYSARSKDSEYLNSDIRIMRLTPIRFLNIRRLVNFFAQSEVDVIRNFPLPGSIPKAENGFGINTYPYYSLSYYSDGKNKILGLVNKLKTNDQALLKKLNSN